MAIILHCFLFAEIATVLFVGAGGLSLWATEMIKAMYGDKVKLVVVDLQVWTYGTVSYLTLIIKFPIIHLHKYRSWSIAAIHFNRYDSIFDMIKIQIINHG